MDGQMESTKYPTMHNRSAIQVRGMSYISASNKVIFRKYEKIFHDIVVAENNEIRKLTGCRKPCTYRQYTFTGERTPTTFRPEVFSFSLWAFSNRTLVKTEQLIYPLSSLVAEFGGTLSLFLGFSFMTLWDKIHDVRKIFESLCRH